MQSKHSRREVFRDSKQTLSHLLKYLGNLWPLFPHIHLLFDTREYLSDLRNTRLCWYRFIEWLGGEKFGKHGKYHQIYRCFASYSWSSAVYDVSLRGYRRIETQEYTTHRNGVSWKLEASLANRFFLLLNVPWRQNIHCLEWPAEPSMNWSMFAI